MDGALTKVDAFAEVPMGMAKAHIIEATVEASTAIHKASHCHW